MKQQDREKIGRNISILLVLVAATLAASAAAQTVEFMSLREGVLEQRLRLATPKASERYRRLKQLFNDTGCPDLHEQKVSHSDEPNLICTVAGENGATRTIIVGAHFDSDGGDGVIDNWTGAILLPSLTEFIRAKPRRHTFEFVGFAAEEKGLRGSAAFLKWLTKEQRQNVAAVITMDSLGMTAVKCWPHSSTRELTELAARLANAMKLSFAGVNVDAVGSADSMTFYQAGLPTLSLHSVTQETLGIINSPHDRRRSLSWRDYYDTHRFISALLVYFDQVLP